MKKIFLALSVCLFSFPAVCQDAGKVVNAPVKQEEVTLGQRLQDLNKKHSQEYAETLRDIKNKPEYERKVLEKFMNHINQKAHKDNGKAADLDEMLDNARDISTYYDIAPGAMDGAADDAKASAEK